MRKIYICVYIYIHFTNFMKYFCVLSWLEISPEAETLRNKDKLLWMSKATVGLPSELRARARPHTCKNLGCKIGRISSCTLIFLNVPLSSSACRWWNTSRCCCESSSDHIKKHLLHRHFQRAAGRHLVQLVTVKDPRGVTALYHSAYERQS